MIEILMLCVAFCLGAGVYRLGRREGEAGRVMPLIRPHRAQKETDKLLKSIEKYDGRKINQ